MPRVLVVEDDPDIALIARELLALAGLEVAGAYTVDEALAVMESEEIDLAVVDLQLPGRSGWDFVARARGTAPGLPVVIYSVHADEPELIAEAAQAAVAVVSKSQDPFVLVDAVRSLLSASTSA
jgi:two-component system C4-dicarboxylate transport response regulator DctD